MKRRQFLTALGAGAGVAVAAVQAAQYDDGRPAVRCLDSEGNCLELIADPGERSDGQQVTGLTHLHLEALDLAATAAFYSRYLGLAVAERILGDRRVTDPEAWGQACAAALEVLRPAHGVRLRVAPGNGPGVRAVLAALPVTAALELTVDEDPTLDEPGCIAESECGRVDGLLSTQLAAIGRAVLPELPE